MGTVIQDRPQRKADRPRRWDRTQRAELFDQYLDLEAQGFSLRQAAQALEVPRSTLGAWRAGPDHGIGHLVLSVLSYSALWRTEWRWRYVDGR